MGCRAGPGCRCSSWLFSTWDRNQRGEDQTERSGHRGGHGIGTRHAEIINATDRREVAFALPGIKAIVGDHILHDSRKARRTSSPQPAMSLGLGITPARVDREFGQRPVDGVCADGRDTGVLPVGAGAVVEDMPHVLVAPGEGTRLIAEVDRAAIACVQVAQHVVPGDGTAAHRDMRAKGGRPLVAAATQVG